MQMIDILGDRGKPGDSDVLRDLQGLSERQKAMQLAKPRNS
jgi:hypothetical protein